MVVGLSPSDSTAKLTDRDFLLVFRDLHKHNGTHLNYLLTYVSCKASHEPLLLDRTVCLPLYAMWPSLGYFTQYCDISKF